VLPFETGCDNGDEDDIGRKGSGQRTTNKPRFFRTLAAREKRRGDRGRVTF